MTSRRVTGPSRPRWPADALVRKCQIHYTSLEIRRAGERISTLKKVFNIREHWRPEDHWLPERLLNEPLTTGVASGAVLSADELREMIRGYYEARGWDQNGFVPQRTLAELGLAALLPATLSTTS